MTVFATESKNESFENFTLHIWPKKEFAEVNQLAKSNFCDG